MRRVKKFRCEGAKNGTQVRCEWISHLGHSMFDAIERFLSKAMQLVTQGYISLTYSQFRISMVTFCACWFDLPEIQRKLQKHTWSGHSFTYLCPIIQALESVHISIAKVIQGLPKQICGPAVLIHIRLLSNSIVHGSYCSLHSWKRTVRKHINSVERNGWLVQSSMYSKLILFRQCHAENMHVWPWWVHTRYYPKDTRYCKTMVRLMVVEHGQSSNIRRRRCKGQSRLTRLCQLCDMYVEDVPHILCTCPIVFYKFNLFWTTVSQVAPKLLIMVKRGMPPVERTIFLLSWFQCPYVVEWEYAYIYI